MFAKKTAHVDTMFGSPTHLPPPLQFSKCEQSATFDLRRQPSAPSTVKSSKHLQTFLSMHLPPPLQLVNDEQSNAIVVVVGTIDVSVVVVVVVVVFAKIVVAARQFDWQPSRTNKNSDLVHQDCRAERWPSVSLRRC